MILFTSYFGKQARKYDSNKIYVSIAVGNPKYELPFELKHLNEVKPYGLTWKYEGEEFERKYIERLERIGLDRILRAISSLAEEDKDIVFLCFEKNPQDCHRSILARWISERTGEVIDEL